MKALKLLQKNLVFVIPVTMILGLFYGNFGNISFFKTLIMPLTFLMVYPMMVNMQVQQILAPGDTKVQVATQLINFLITPLLAFIIGLVFFPDSSFLRLGLLLTGLLPTSGMTISWTGMAKGNMAAAVKMTVIGLLLGSTLTPVYLKLLMGSNVSVNILSIFKQIIIIVVGPLVLGNLTRKIIVQKVGLQHYNEHIKALFPPISTLGVVGIVFVAMALKARDILNNPLMLFKITLPIFILYVINFGISVLIGKKFFHRAEAIALLYGTVMRNLSIALAIAMTSFGKAGSEIALVIAMGYIFQIQLAAWFVKFTDKVYGQERVLVHQ